MIVEVCIDTVYWLWWGYEKWLVGVPKLRVAGSNPVSRSILNTTLRWHLEHVGEPLQSAPADTS